MKLKDFFEDKVEVSAGLLILNMILAVIVLVISIIF